MTRRPLPSAAALVLVLAPLLSLTACGGDEEAPADTGPEPIALGPADLARAEREAVAEGVRITGSLDPADRVEVNAQLGGQLDRVLVEEGERVDEGQTLAAYDASTVRARVSEAEARLAAARRDLEAAQLLHREGAMAERDLVEARVAFDTAQSQLTIARESLAHARVTSPIAGTVTEREVSSGEAVTVGQHLFTVVDVSTLELAGRVPAARIGAVEPGQPVALDVESYAPGAVRGEVARVEPVADPTSRQVTVHVEVANPGRELVGGLFATGTILTGEDRGERLPVVPASAVVEREGSPAVFVVGDDALALRPIEVGTRDEERGIVQVTSGLSGGELVVRTPRPGLEAGVPVRLLEAVDVAQRGEMGDLP